MIPTSIHEKALQNWSWAKLDLAAWEESHSHLPKWIASKILKSKRKTALKRAAKDAGEKPRWPSKSARGQEYLAEMGMFSRALRPVVSVKGAAFREIVKQIRNHYFSRVFDSTVTRSLSDSDLGGLVGEIRSTGIFIERIDGCDERRWTAKWAGSFDAAREAAHADYGVCCLIMMALRNAARLEVGRTHYAAMMQRLADPKATIGGYLASSLTDMLSDPTSSAGYEQCSGGEMTTYIRKCLSRADHENLLRRAPVGVVTATAIQCYPHELSKTAACRAAGLSETFRMNDSVYSGSPEQVKAAMMALED